MSTAEPIPEVSPEQLAAFQQQAKVELEAAFERLGAAIQFADKVGLDPSEYLDPARLMQIMGMG